MITPDLIRGVGATGGRPNEGEDPSRCTRNYAPAPDNDPGFAGMTEKTSVTVSLPDSPSRMTKWTLFLASTLTVPNLRLSWLSFRRIEESQQVRSRFEQPCGVSREYFPIHLEVPDKRIELLVFAVRRSINPGGLSVSFSRSASDFA